MSEYLTKEQLKQCWYYFDLLDKEGKKHITTKELGTVMKSIGLGMSDGELRELLKEVNPTDSNEIDFPEFASLLTRKMKDIETEEELRRVFQEFDKSGKGTIAISDLQHISSVLGEQFTNEELSEMLAEADVDHDGVLNYDDFVRMMMAT